MVAKAIFEVSQHSNCFCNLKFKRELGCACKQIDKTRKAYFQLDVERDGKTVDFEIMIALNFQNRKHLR